MKKYYFIVLLATLPSFLYAYDAEIDGIYYNLVSKLNIATVTYGINVQNSYKGDVKIPSTVSYEGINYIVTSIGDEAFYECHNLSSIEIPNTVSSIGAFAFHECNRLSSISIPNSVKEIKEYAFQLCNRLKSVNINDIASWVSIDFKSNPLAYAHRLFLNDIEVNNLEIPEGVTSISRYAFEGCTSLNSVVIPSSVTDINDGAFWECTSLTSFVMPNSVKSIGLNAFYRCSSLNDIELSNNLSFIGSNAFSECSNLTTLEIPNSVKEIGAYAFSDCINLSYISLPENIKQIDYGLFNNCRSLKAIIIPSSVIEIKNYAFANCVGLKTIDIPNKVEIIEYNAFDNCSNLSTISLGRSISRIGDQSFANCRNLTDVYCYASEVPTTKNNAFTGSYIEYATLHVPAESVIAYKEKEPWNAFKSIVTIEGEIPETPKCATPIIKYFNGKLSFSSETEDVKFVTDITDSDIKKHYDTEINLSVTYNINVYATKPGYDDSDIATATLCWVEAEPITEGVENDIANIKARPVMIQYIGGSFNVSGLSDGDTVTIYTLDGSIIGQSECKDGTARIQSEQKKGSTVIIRFGKQSLKYQIM